MRYDDFKLSSIEILSVLRDKRGYEEGRENDTFAAHSDDSEWEEENGTKWSV
jgi:hypothetical protein